MPEMFDSAPRDENRSGADSSPVSGPAKREGLRSKHGPGRGNRIRPAEATAIRAASIAGLSGNEIARRTGRSKAAVSRILSDAESQQAREMARSILTANAAQAVDDWMTASRVGALKGRHEAARDWLTHVRAVNPPQKGETKGQGVVIQLGCILPGLPDDAATEIAIPAESVRPVTDDEDAD